MKTIIKNHNDELLEVDVFYSKDFLEFSTWAIFCQVTLDDGTKKKFKVISKEAILISCIDFSIAKGFSDDDIQEQYNSAFLKYFKQDILMFIHSMEDLQQVQENLK